MKKTMMIIGCEIISSNEKKPDDSVFKLCLVPLTTVRKVTAMSAIINKGSFEDMIDSALSHQQTQLKDSMYISMGEWKQQGYRIGSHVSVEVLPDGS